MDEMEYFDAETVTIPMEDGTDQECAILEIFEVQGKKYVVVAPVNDDVIDDEAYIYGYEEEGEEIIISNIEDDAEFEMASAAYDELCSAEE